MIFLWSVLVVLWVGLAISYFVSYRKWKRIDQLRRAERSEWRAKSGL